MISEKLNESFYKITGSYEQIQPIIRKLTATEMEYKVTPFSSGFSKNEIPFYRIVQAEDPLEKSIVVPSGLVQFLRGFGVNYINGNEFSENDVNEWIKEFKLILPFEPYDYQELAIQESILKQQQLVLAATGSGKSIIIAGIVEFFRLKGLKGLILVPNISLTTQLLQDIKDYNLPELANNTRIIGGDNNEKVLDKPLTISTWQSMLKLIESSTPKECGLLNLDYIIIDEAHGLKFENKMTDIVLQSNARFRIGCTGTLPDDEVSKMAILSCVGAPKRYIRTQGLIERGLATPVRINALIFRYRDTDKAMFKHVGNHAKRLKFIKEHNNRNDFIAKLAENVKENGNTVVMCSHIQHMKDIFEKLVKLKDPTVKITEKDITGKSSFDFQKQYNIFYIAGATKVKDREFILDILKNFENVTIVTGYALFSTGLNIKSLKNIIFASPLKSYTTISQSIGRAIRTHVSKDTAEIYDLVDDFSVRGNSGPFYNQYKERLTKSYNSEGFPIFERIVNI